MANSTQTNLQPGQVPAFQIGRWQVDVLNGGHFVMDGGILFGVVPRRLWSMVREPDELNRLRVACNCLLLRDGEHTVLIDTGYGSKQSPLDRRFYLLEEGDPIVDNLARCGVRPDDVDTVIFTHLHWDHVGGASYKNDRGEVVLSFPRARHIVGRWEWEDATSNMPELAGTYSDVNLRPLREQTALELIDNDYEILPGVRALLTGGHTRGHLAISIESAGDTALFISDLCPSAYHLNRFWCLAYDLYPLETRRKKPALLGRAADDNWIVFWTHDATNSASRLARHPKREFAVIESWPAP